MKSLLRARTVTASVFLGFASMISQASAGPRSACDQSANDVRQAVGKDPAKVLMIVEDALVISETCACEIVKAAIMATSADEANVMQIVQTALAVAPKMSAVIAECAAAVAPGAGGAIAALVGGKEKSSVTQAPTGGGKGVVADVVPTGDGKGFVAPVTSVAPTVDSDSSNAWSTNIRGVYLVQPAAAGFITQVAQADDDDGGGGGGGGGDDNESVNHTNSRRTRNLVPLSPATAHP